MIDDLQPKTTPVVIVLWCDRRSPIEDTTRDSRQKGPGVENTIYHQITI